MIVDCVLTPAEIGFLPHRNLRDTTAVVFDVLRATSSILTALAHGAVAVHPVTSIEEALELRQTMPGAVLGGERNGDKIEGFDVGNSPSEYAGLAGRTVITTTTNGTVALRACGHARQVLVGALLNLGALAAFLANDPPRELLLVCAGTHEHFAIEDAFGAGALIHELHPTELTDSARAALSVFERHQDQPLACLRTARNGQALLRAGRAGDIEWAANCSLYPIVGGMTGGVIRSIAP